MGLSDDEIRDIYERHNRKSRWEVLEEVLIDHDTDRFTVGEIAGWLELSNAEGSLYIQAYLDAQRRPNSNTLFVLKREGRTSNAIWSVGERAADMRILGDTLFADVTRKVNRAFEPDLAKLAARNPRLRKRAERKIARVVGNALGYLRDMLDELHDAEE